MSLGYLRQFYQKFNIPANDRPAFPKGDRLEWRIKFLEEELLEMREAVELGDMPKFFDALIDLEYVLLGTVLEAGLGSAWAEGFQAVHRANMAKVPGPTHRGATTVDLMKPEGWKPADLEKILRLCGWKSEERKQGVFTLDT